MFESDGLRVAPWFADMVANNGTGPLVGVTLVLFALALVLVGMGFKSAPIAWGLIASGSGVGVLGFLVMAAAIQRTGLEGQNAVTNAGPMLLPWSVALAAAGLGAHGARVAWSLWISGENSKRGAAAVVGVGVLLSAIFAVQVARGGNVIPPRPGLAELGITGAAPSGNTPGATSGGSDDIPHRCTTCRRFR